MAYAEHIDELSWPEGELYSSLNGRIDNPTVADYERTLATRYNWAVAPKIDRWANKYSAATVINKSAIASTTT